MELNKVYFNNVTNIWNASFDSVDARFNHSFLLVLLSKRGNSSFLQSMNFVRSEILKSYET